MEERWKMEAAAKQEKGSEEVNLGIGKEIGREGAWDGRLFITLGCQEERARNEKSAEQKGYEDVM